MHGTFRANNISCSSSDEVNICVHMGTKSKVNYKIECRECNRWNYLEEADSENKNVAKMIENKFRGVKMEINEINRIKIKELRDKKIKIYL